MYTNFTSLDFLQPMQRITSSVSALLTNIDGAPDSNIILPDSAVSYHIDHIRWIHAPYCRCVPH